MHYIMLLKSSCTLNLYSNMFWWGATTIVEELYKLKHLCCKDCHIIMHMQLDPIRSIYQHRTQWAQMCSIVSYGSFLCSCVL